MVVRRGKVNKTYYKPTREYVERTKIVYNSPRKRREYYNTYVKARELFGEDNITPYKKMPRFQRVTSNDIVNTDGSSELTNNSVGYSVNLFGIFVFILIAIALISLLINSDRSIYDLLLDMGHLISDFGGDFRECISRVKGEEFGLSNFLTTNSSAFWKLLSEWIGAERLSNFLGTIKGIFVFAFEFIKLCFNLIVGFFKLLF